MAKHYRTKSDVPIRTRLPSGETEISITEEEWENGFDKLLRVKEEHLVVLDQYFTNNPSATREGAAEKLGVSLRTVTRYLKELRKRSGGISTQSDAQMAEKQQRVLKLKQLVKMHPDWTREQYRKTLGVSYRTLLSYFAELPTIS